MTRPENQVPELDIRSVGMLLRKLVDDLCEGKVPDDEKQVLRTLINALIKDIESSGINEAKAAVTITKLRYLIFDDTPIGEMYRASLKGEDPIKAFNAKKESLSKEHDKVSALRAEIKATFDEFQQLFPDLWASLNQRDKDILTNLIDYIFSVKTVEELEVLASTINKSFTIFSINYK